MNIFILDENPEMAAIYHNNKHVVKMILESTQLLNNAYYYTDTSFEDYPRESPYKLTHKNHPCSIWARENINNWNWLHKLATSLCNEYTYRYGKEHKCVNILNWMETHPPNLKNDRISKFALAMPKTLHTNNPIKSYRFYYILYKHHLLEWKKRPMPYWVINYTKKINKIACLID